MPFRRKLLLLVAISFLSPPIFAANPAGVGFEAAARSMTNFHVASGLSVSLFAAEPLPAEQTTLSGTGTTNAFSSTYLLQVQLVYIIRQGL